MIATINMANEIINDNAWYVSICNHSFPIIREMLEWQTATAYQLLAIILHIITYIVNNLFWSFISTVLYFLVFLGNILRYRFDKLETVV
jgi:hypothetical protein